MNIAKVAQKTKDGLETANKEGKVLKTFWKHALAQAAPAPVVQRSEFQITHFVVRSKRTFNEINDSRWQSTDSIHFELVCVCVWYKSALKRTRKGFEKTNFKLPHKIAHWLQLTYI